MITSRTAEEPPFIYVAPAFELITPRHQQKCPRLWVLFPDDTCKEVTTAKKKQLVLYAWRKKLHTMKETAEREEVERSWLHTQLEAYDFNIRSWRVVDGVLSVCTSVWQNVVIEDKDVLWVMEQ